MRQHGGSGLRLLLAGFYILRIYNMTTATIAAVAINLAVAGSATCWRHARIRNERRRPAGPTAAAQPVFEPAGNAGPFT